MSLDYKSHEIVRALIFLEFLARLDSGARWNGDKAPERVWKRKGWARYEADGEGDRLWSVTPAGRAAIEAYWRHFGIELSDLKWVPEESP